MTKDDGNKLSIALLLDDFLKIKLCIKYCWNPQMIHEIALRKVELRVVSPFHNLSHSDVLFSSELVNFK